LKRTSSISYTAQKEVRKVYRIRECTPKRKRGERVCYCSLGGKESVASISLTAKKKKRESLRVVQGPWEGRILKSYKH